VEPADEEVVALVLQELEDVARVLAHQDRVGRVVVDAELVADLVLLRDAMEADPHARRVADLVVPQVGRVPARHRALLDAVLEAAVLGRLQEGHEAPLEVLEVLVHVERDVPAHEPAHRLHPEGDGGVHDLHHPVVLDPAQPLVAHEHVVEVAEVREAHLGGLEGGLDAAHAAGIERLEHVQVIGHRIEHRLRRHVRQLFGQGGGELEAVHARGSRPKRIQSSTARSGSWRRLSRGVSSCSAAVRTDICMYSGLELFAHEELRRSDDPASRGARPLYSDYEGPSGHPFFSTCTSPVSRCAPTPRSHRR
jgi:hypothetical protein